MPGPAPLLSGESAALRRPVAEWEGPRRERTYAALDLGTNNCRLLVARPTDHGFRVVDAFSRIVRLGENLGASGRLSDEAMDRAIAALRVCRAKIEQRRVDRVRLIATEACRAAANGEAFIARVARETSLKLDIVDRGCEARLAAAGCTPLVADDVEGVVLFDIGGGSSELVWLQTTPSRDRGPPHAGVRAWISLPVGVVTLAERHGGRKVTREIYERMCEEVAGMVAAFPEREALRAVLPRLHMLGTSGTVTTLAGIHLGLKRYDRRRVDGAWMDRTEVAAIIESLLATSYEDRCANACIGPDRADLVLAGCAILDGISRHFGCGRLRIADRGLREGLLVEMMRADQVWSGAARSLAR